MALRYLDDELRLGCGRFQLLLSLSPGADDLRQWLVVDDRLGHRLLVEQGHCLVVRALGHQRFGLQGEELILHEVGIACVKDAALHEEIGLVLMEDVLPAGQGASRANQSASQHPQKQLHNAYMEHTLTDGMLSATPRKAAHTQQAVRTPAQVSAHTHSAAAVSDPFITAISCPLIASFWLRVESCLSGPIVAHGVETGCHRHVVYYSNRSGLVWFITGPTYMCVMSVLRLYNVTPWLQSHWCA
jgi:hypothetical protein